MSPSMQADRKSRAARTIRQRCPQLVGQWQYLQLPEVKHHSPSVTLLLLHKLLLLIHFHLYHSLLSIFIHVYPFLVWSRTGWLRPSQASGASWALSCRILDRVPAWLWEVQKQVGWGTWLVQTHQSWRWVCVQTKHTLCDWGNNFPNKTKRRQERERLEYFNPTKLWYQAPKKEMVQAEARHG